MLSTDILEQNGNMRVACGVVYVLNVNRISKNLKSFVLVALISETNWFSEHVLSSVGTPSTDDNDVT